MDERNNPQNPTSPGIPIQVQNPSNVPGTIPNEDEKPPKKPDPQYLSPGIPNEDEKPPEKPDPQYPSHGILNVDEKPPKEPDSQYESPGFPNEDEKPPKKPNPQHPSPGIPNEDEKPPEKPDPQYLSPGIPNEDEKPEKPDPQYPSPGILNVDEKPPKEPESQYESPGIPNEDETPPKKPNPQYPSPGIPNEDEKPPEKPDSQYLSPGIPYKGQDPYNVPGPQNTSTSIPNQDLNLFNVASSQPPSPDNPNQAQNTYNGPDPQNTSPGIPNQGISSVPESQYPSHDIPYEGLKPSDMPDPQNTSTIIPNQDQNLFNVAVPQHQSPDNQNQAQNTYNVPDLQNTSPGIPKQGISSAPESQYLSPDIPYEGLKPSDMPDPQNTSTGIPNQDQNTYDVPDPQNTSPGIQNQDTNLSNVPELQYASPDIPYEGQKPSDMPGSQYPSPEIPNHVQDPDNVPEPQHTLPGIPNQDLNPSNVPGLQNASPGSPNQGQNPLFNAPGPQNQSPGIQNQGLGHSKASGPNAPQDQSTSTGPAPDTQSIKSGGNPGLNEELHGKVTKYMLYSVISAILGMFQFGYNAGAINQPREFIEAFILLQDAPNDKPSDAGLMFSIIVGVFAIGGMVGSPLSAYLCDKFGRKEILISNAAFGIVGSLLMAFCKEANSVEMLIVGRFLNGINCGVSSAVCPTYVSEIAPVNLRGAFGAANQLAIAIGVTFGQVLGIDPILGSDDTWPILFGLVAVPALIQCIMLFFAPKSPRYLLFVLRDEERAKKILFRLRGTPDIDEEIRAMHVEDRLEKEGEKFGFIQLFKQRHLLRPLIIGIVLHLSHQFGGINVLLNFSSTIFEDATLTAYQARLASIGVGVVLILNVFISIFFMDHFGRRKLELAGLGGMAVFSALMTVGLNIDNFIVNVMTIIFAFCYIASFGIGPSSIPWMLMSEMFTQSARSTAVSIGAMVNWFANFVVGISFVSLRDGFATYVFLPFTVLLIIFFIFVYFFLPETRHKTHEQMHKHFKDGIELPGGFIL